MIKHKISPSGDYHNWLKRLYTQLNVTNNQNLIKVPKVDEQTNRKT